MYHLVTRAIYLDSANKYYRDFIYIIDVVLDISKATETFGWKLKVSLEEGMIMYYKWMQDSLDKGII